MLGLSHAPTQAITSRDDPATSWGILPPKPGVASHEGIVTAAWPLWPLFCSPSAGKGWGGYSFSLWVLTTFAHAPH